ncbi:MAG: hypothetical protein WA949_23580 [Phormidesmis sp.]
MSFSLPPEISFTKQPIRGGMVFQFRHQSLGDLGRLVLQDRADGQCHITSEVVGAPDDPMTKTRSELFLPISEKLTAALEAATSNKGRPSAGLPAQVKTPPAPMERIPSTQIPCERCGKVAAHLIFADYAREVSGLEDCARKMYHIYKKVNVPTWIIGAPLGIPSDHTPALTLKVWPKRQEAKPISPADFNAALDKILEKHC